MGESKGVDKIHHHPHKKQKPTKNKGDLPGEGSTHQLAPEIPASCLNARPLFSAGRKESAEAGPGGAPPPAPQRRCPARAPVPVPVPTAALTSASRSATVPAILWKRWRRRWGQGGGRGRGREGWREGGSVAAPAAER